MMKTVLATLLSLALLGVAGGAAFVYSGVYDVSATGEHIQPVYSLIEQTMRSSVRQRARDIQPPALDGAHTIARGAACYRDQCLQCHGAPGVPPGPMGKSMQPLPGPLVDAARRWRERELYWITRHGVKMSGMPAWEARLSEQDLWAVVAFLRELPKLSPADYAGRMAALPPAQCSAAPATDAQRIEEEKGRLLLRQYACNGCHIIPGLTGSNTHVGPPLAGLARRSLIAGKLPQSTDNLVRWIRDPQEIKPGTAMPDMDVTEEHARQMAAYLATLQ